MKTPHSTLYRFTAETIAHANRLPVKTISEHAHKWGMTEGEPLIVAMDAMIKYAEAYRIRYESSLSEDSALGDPWLESVKGIRALLNGDGAMALKQGVTTDSKDNGAVEGMFWDALRIAGYTEETANL